ncbi:AAA family ATPase [Vibrio harveyi]|nr:AAA family ATPase [Vibrio harveyi]
MMVGVNGTGKTTSLAKVANYYAEQNYKVLIAAADTFRAGAAKQLEE